MAGKAISFAACLQKAAKLKRRAREEVGPTPGVRFADLGTLEVLFGVWCCSYCFFICKSGALQ